MLQINNETAHKMFFQIMERFDKIDRALERMNKLKDCLDGDTLLDNYDLCRLLGITKRTLVIAGKIQGAGKCLTIKWNKNHGNHMY